MLNRDRQRGFTLLELLIVTAIIGLIASILIPNLMDALQKARQKRTMTDLRGLGSAWMAWLTDQHGAASAGAAKTYDRSGYSQIDYVGMQAYLRPTDTFFYAQDVPQTDAWGHDLAFAMELSSGIPNNIFACAPARDNLFGQCNTGLISVVPFLSTDYDQDIIWADGYFLRWPDALGRQNQ